MYKQCSQQQSQSIGLKMWPMDQHNLGTCQKCTFEGPTLQNYHVRNLEVGQLSML